MSGKCPLPEPRSRWGVTGKSGTGKSSLVKDALREWTARGVRIVALDPLDEYSRAGRGDPGLVSSGPLVRRVTAAQLAASPALLLDPRLSLAVVPSSKEPRDQAAAAILLMRMVRGAGRLLLVLDEVSSWTNSSLHPSCHKAGALLVSLTENGRHDGVALVLVSQRAAGIPVGARALLSSITTFLQDEADDLAALDKRTRGRLEPAAVAALRPFQCLTWRDTDATAEVPTPTPATALRIAGSPGSDATAKEPHTRKKVPA